MITIADTEHIARLSALSLSENDIVRLTSQLEEIAAYASVLKELDTSKTEPPSSVKLSELRTDDVIYPGGSLSKEEILINTPAFSNGYISVPKIISDEK